MFFVLVLSLFQPLILDSQTNLIYNGDFELYDTCPNNPSSPGDLEIEHCLGWTAPTKLGTSDYFNICNNTSVFHLAGVPQNLIGFQYPYNGNGYCGIIAWNIGLSNGESYREYIQTKLIRVLESGVNYHFSFHVAYYGVNYSLEKIGALFSANDYNSNSYTPIIATPQIKNQNSFITDSLNWTKIEGDFYALGGEQFLTIGYFEDSLSVKDTFNTYNDPLALYDSYYFIDGVELVENEEQIPNIFSPNNNGVNDEWNPKVKDGEFIEIYNRWGTKICELSQGQRWNGRTSSGEECNEGVYYFVIRTKQELKSEFKKGFIQLVR